MQIKYSFWLILCLMGLLTGCVQQNSVRTDYNPQQNFTHLTDWNWSPKFHKQSIKHTQSLINQRIHDAITNDLTSRGYKLSDHPNFYVDYHIFANNKKNTVTQVRPYGGYAVNYGAYPYLWSPAYATTYTRYYRENTLFIRIIDAKTRNVIWNGTIILKITDDNTPESRLQQVNKLVRTLLDQFPPETHKAKPATST